MNPKRTILMTGASRGLGYHAALHILKNYPDVHLVVSSRDSETGRLARSLHDGSGGGKVTEVFADLASLDSVQAMAENVAAMADNGSVPPLHGLLANAGAQFTSTTRATSDGHEMTFGVNVLANVVLVDVLKSRMAQPGRIVITTSDTHFGDFRHNMGMVPAPVWRNVQELAQPGTGPQASTARAGATAYSTSKLAVIYYVHVLARHLPAGLDVYSYNPGLVPGTGLIRDRDVVSRTAWKTVMPMMNATKWADSPKRAGRLLAEASAGPRPGESGLYLDRGAPAPSSAESHDAERENALWNALQILCH